MNDTGEFGIGKADIKYPDKGRIYISLEDASLHSPIPLSNNLIYGRGLKESTKNSYHFSVITNGDYDDLEKIFNKERYIISEEWGIYSDDFRDYALSNHTDSIDKMYGLCYIEDHVKAFRYRDIYEYTDRTYEPYGMYYGNVQTASSLVEDINPNIESLLKNERNVKKRFLELRDYEETNEPIMFFEGSHDINPGKHIITLDLHGYKRYSAEKALKMLKNVLIEYEIPISKIVYGKSGNDMKSATIDFIKEEENIKGNTVYLDTHVFIKNTRSKLDERIGYKIGREFKSNDKKVYNGEVEPPTKKPKISPREADENVECAFEASFDA